MDIVDHTDGRPAGTGVAALADLALADVMAEALAAG
jgi:hypothetical protein